jgi:hypothetical protein
MTLFAAAFLMTCRLAADETIPLYSASIPIDQAHRVDLDYKIAATRFLSLPTWDTRTESIPLPVDKAIAIARGGAIPANPHGRVASIQFEQRNNRWWYVISFEARPTQNPSQNPEAWPTVVLMDGTVVLPEVIERRIASAAH